MDIDEIKYSEAEKYHILTIEFIRNLISKLIETKWYKHMDKAEDISIIGGEYMDESEVLYKEGEE